VHLPEQENAMEATRTDVKKHLGSCHCGDVKFAVEMDARTASKCNCTICTKTASTNGIVKPEAFTLLSDPAKLSTYEWGGKTGTRYFCKSCGVHAFGRGNLPEIGGAYVSVNLNCLDDIDVATVKLVYFDGRHNNWEAGVRDPPWPV
jgi:hypothetical protein